MAISSLAVANFFVKKSLESGEVELTPMKLVKLVYIAHGWSLAFRGEPLITEAVEAWKYGPVVERVYDNFKRFKGGQITSMTESLEIDSNGGYHKIVHEVTEEDDKALLESVWNAYSHYSGLELSASTHKEGAPWWITWFDNKGSEKSNAIIPNDIIKRHYTNLLKMKTETSGQ